ncbi:hypothetical protein DOY81_003067 [Sarcophaga bullata]|nr:hypothetical protein DOY81_003067 [Sarcophaga bullata]
MQKSTSLTRTQLYRLVTTKPYNSSISSRKRNCQSMLLLKLINIQKNTQTHACCYDTKRLIKTKKIEQNLSDRTNSTTTVLRAAKTLMNEKSNRK